MDSIATSTNRTLPAMAQMHLWVVVFHTVELFKWLIPEEDNHVVMALVASTMTKLLSELDTDYDWQSWVTDVYEE